MFSSMAPFTHLNTPRLRHQHFMFRRGQPLPDGSRRPGQHAGHRVDVDRRVRYPGQYELPFDDALAVLDEQGFYGLAELVDGLWEEVVFVRIWEAWLM